MGDKKKRKPMKHQVHPYEPNYRVEEKNVYEGPPCKLCNLPDSNKIHDAEEMGS